jgi:spermidine/putrescine transport system permease protein
MARAVKFFAYCYAATIFVLIFLPAIVLVLFSLQESSLPVPPFNGPSLRWYQAVLSDQRLVTSLINSLMVAVVSSGLSVVLGFLAAWGFARHLLPGQRILRGLIMLPMAVSYLIIGMGLLIFFNNLGIAKSLASATAGHVVMNLPLCFAIIYSQMGGHQVNIESAARDLGASELQVMLLVTAPMLSPAIFASFFLSMTFSWDEFVIAFLLTRFQTTLPVDIWSLLRTGLSPKINAVGSLVFSISIVMAILAEVLVFWRKA